MVRRAWWTLVVLLVLIPFASAAHSAFVTTTYVPIYETNTVDVVLDVENNFSSLNSINEVDAQTQGFTINNIISLLDWSVTNNNSITFSTSTAAISNWGSQKFGFGVTANNVNADTVYDWTITTTDTNGDGEISLVQLMVMNDGTAPNITSILPGAFILGNTELFQITADDPETGVASSDVYVSDCDLVFDNVTNSSSIVYNPSALTCQGDTCNESVDLSTWSEGDVCFYYTVSNNGGETAQTNNLTTIIDRTAPSVSLLSPANDSFLNVTVVDLIFSAQDNYDTNVSCIITVDNATYNVNAVSNSTTYQLPVNDGTYTWSVSCTDEVGLVGNSATQSFSVDNQGPNVTITAPAVVDRGTDAIINVSIVDDGSGVDQASVSATVTDPNNNITVVTIVNDQITFPTTIASVPGTYVLDVSAADNIGQATQAQATFRVRETFAVTLTLSQSQIDASTPNLTYYINGSGSVTKDDGSIPLGMVDIMAILTNTSENIDNVTGAFLSSIEIPQTNGLYTIIATFTSGVDTFTATADVGVGPYCGNGVVDTGEECDGSPINSCSDYGYSQGAVSCSASCTHDTSSCSNPPSSSGGGGSSGGGSSGVINNNLFPEEEVIFIEEETSSGLGQEVEEEVVEPEPEPETSTGLVEEEPETSSGFGIGAAWASLVNFTQGLNMLLLVALAVIGSLLYIFGWKKKEKKEWNSYLKK